MRHPDEYLETARFDKARELLDSTLKKHRVPREMFLSGRRESWLVGLRRELVKALRDLGYSFPEIGILMDRDYSSIINLVNPKKRKEGREKKREEP